MFDSLFNFFRLNVAGGHEDEFEKLIREGKVDEVKSKMDNRADLIKKALKDYDPTRHDINYRKNKIMKDKNGKRKGEVRRWKLPIDYPRYINEIAVVFLYGQPIKWGSKPNDESINIDEAFDAFNNLLESTHFNAKIRQCKRYAGAETQSAMYFRTYKKQELVNDKIVETPQCQIRVLAKQKGDVIYSRWDQYENLLAVGWEYSVNEGNVTVEHFDLFLPNVIYHCKRGDNEWIIAPEQNRIGKIPVILFQQEVEWSGVEPQIEREEYIVSRTADTNDYFSDPTQILNADIIKNMPDKDTENKTFVVRGDGVDAHKAAHYLTWDSAPESKKQEVEWLQNHILSKTFTPNIDFDNMKSLSNVSGKALKQMMILANIKAQKRQETHDELIHRAGNLMKAIIGNVLDIRLKPQLDNMILTHEFQEPFGEDIMESVETIAKAVDSGFMSKESGIEQSPMTKDAQLEKDRVNKESQEQLSAQRDIFTQSLNQSSGLSEGENSGAE